MRHLDGRLRHEIGTFSRSGGCVDRSGQPLSAAQLSLSIFGSAVGAGGAVVSIESRRRKRYLAHT